MPYAYGPPVYHTYGPPGKLHKLRLGLRLIISVTAETFRDADAEGLGVVRELRLGGGLRLLLHLLLPRRRQST